MARKSQSEVVDDQTVSTAGPSVLEAKIQAVVEQWTSAHLHNSPFSRNTEAWNHFQFGLPALIKGIVKEVEGK